MLYHVQHFFIFVTVNLPQQHQLNVRDLTYGALDGSKDSTLGIFLGISVPEKSNLNALHFNSAYYFQKR